MKGYAKETPPNIYRSSKDKEGRRIKKTISKTNQGCM
jgi:hypothetical protein